MSHARHGRVLAWTGLLLVVGLLYLPLLPPLATSVSPTGRQPDLSEPTLRWYVELPNNPTLVGSIETSVKVQSVLEAQLLPEVLTPNGDGINDEGRIVYDLVETTGGVPVEVEILDLLGRKVRGIYRGLDGIGHYERTWDGRNGEGKTVPPGIYIWRVSGELERGRATRTGILGVSY